VTFDEVPLGTLAAAKPALDPVTAHRNRLSLERLGEHLDRQVEEVDATGP
jgi:hypothetical protein